MAKQGICRECNIAFEWRKDYPLSRMRCLQCGGELERTSNQFQGEWRNWMTGVVVRRARKGKGRGSNIKL